MVRFRPIMMTTMAALMGTAADRARVRRRRGFAAPAGPGGVRRTDILADGDAVFDAGFLHVHGYFPELAGAPFWESNRKKECRPTGWPRFCRLARWRNWTSSLRKFFVRLSCRTGMRAKLYQNHLSLRTIDRAIGAA